MDPAEAPSGCRAAARGARRHDGRGGDPAQVGRRPDQPRPMERRAVGGRTSSRTTARSGSSASRRPATISSRSGPDPPVPRSSPAATGGRGIARSTPAPSAAPSSSMSTATRPGSRSSAAPRAGRRSGRLPTGPAGRRRASAIQPGSCGRSRPTAGSRWPWEVRAPAARPGAPTSPAPRGTRPTAPGSSRRSWARRLPAS